jgi:hypothetical protein
VASQQEINKMSIANLSIVFGPCLIRIPAPENEIQQAMKETMKTSEMIKVMLENYELIFEERVTVEMPISVNKPMSLQAVSSSPHIQSKPKKLYAYLDEHSSSSLYLRTNFSSTTPMSPLTPSEKLQVDNIQGRRISQRKNIQIAGKTISEESLDLASSSGSNLRIGRKKPVQSKRDPIRPTNRPVNFPDSADSVFGMAHIKATGGSSVESVVASIVSIRPKTISINSNDANIELGGHSFDANTQNSLSTKSIESAAKSNSDRSSSILCKKQSDKNESTLSYHADQKHVKHLSFSGMEPPLRRPVSRLSHESSQDRQSILRSISPQHQIAGDQMLDKPYIERAQSEQKNSKPEDLLRCISSKKKSNNEREMVNNPPNRPAPPTPLPFFSSLIASIPEIEKQMSDKEPSKLSPLSKEFEGVKKIFNENAEKSNTRETQHKRLMSHQYEAQSETLMAKRANSVNATRKISYNRLISSNKVRSTKNMNGTSSSIDTGEDYKAISYKDLLKSDKLPGLNALSKDVVIKIKSTFKSLNQLMHAKTATVEEEIIYKRLKRIIKGICRLMISLAIKRNCRKGSLGGSTTKLGYICQHH